MDAAAQRLLRQGGCKWQAAGHAVVRASLLWADFISVEDAFSSEYHSYPASRPPAHEKKPRPASPPRGP
jgi:hypothetical protein